MRSESHRGPRESLEERRALLVGNYLGEKEQVPHGPQIIVLDAESRRSQRRRVLLRHFKIATIVVAAFLFVAFLTRSGESICHEPTHYNVGQSSCAQASKGRNWATNAPTPQACHDNATANYSFDFVNLSDWRFEKILDISGISTKYLRSEIRLQPAPTFIEKDVTVNISITTNKEHVLHLLKSQKSNNELVFKVVVPQDTQDLCLSIDADVYVRPGFKISKLGILSNIASLRILPGLETIEIEKTNIDLKVGDVSAAPLNSRETRIDAGAGSVNGRFDLYDLLSVHTIGGSIQIDVIPKEAAEDRPIPAKLVVGAIAGSVGVTYPPLGTDIPWRDYETYVSSSSGSIHGNYIHGTATTMRSRTGEISVNILPFTGDYYASSLHTSTQAGSQRISLLPPYSSPRISIKRLDSSHFTHSGSLQVEYPQEWEGNIKGSTKAGSLKLEGKDVRVVEEGRYGPLGQWVRAVKGDGEGSLEFGTQAGSANVAIGDV